MLISSKFTLRAGFVVVLAAAATAAVPVSLASAAPDDLTHAEVAFRSAGVTLHGTVTAPADGEARRPGLVLVHGSGPGPRTSLRPEAEAFARAGIVTLAYDKRTVGYSQTQRSYALLADDALAALEALQARPEVDPARVGLWGLSEGGWVAPLAASRSADVAFLITVGANGVSPARQQAWSNRTYLSRGGVSESLLEPLGVAGIRLLARAGVFPEAHYDPVPVLERVRQPVLALWGEQDLATPPGESVRIFPEALERGGNTHYTIRVFPGADHDLRSSPDNLRSEGDFPPGYVELVGSWVGDLADGPPQANADPPPHQDRRSAPLAPLAWYESVPMQLGALGLSALAFLVYPLGTLVRRISGRRGPLPVRSPARVLAIAGPITVLLTVVYVGFLASTGARIIGPVALGRPLPWLVLQLLAVVVAGATVATTVAWWRNRDRVTGWARCRLGVLLLGGAVFLPWAGYWGLFTV